MHLVRWFAHRLIGGAIAIIVSILLAGMVAGLGMGFFCAQAIDAGSTASGSPPPPPAPFPPAETLCRAMLGFGLTCLVTVIALVMVWVGSRGLGRPAPTAFLTLTDPSDEEPSEQGVAVIALALALIALPVMVILGVRPAVSFIDQHRELFSGSFAGLLLMVPMFELVIAAACLVAGIGLLLLFATRDRLFPRAYAVLITAQLGLLLTSHQALAVTRSLTAPLEGQVPIADAHVAAVESTNRHLFWAVMAYAGLAPVAILAPSVRRRFAGRPSPSALMDPMLATDPPLHDPPLYDTPLHVDRPAPRPTPEGELQSNRFHVRVTYLAMPFFGGRLKLQDLDLNRGYVVEIAPLALHTTVHVRSNTGGSAAVLRIQARHPLSVGGRYDVFDAQGHEKIGVIRWRFADDWLIHDPRDRRVGILTAGERSLGQGTYHAFIGPHEVGRLSWANVLGPTLELDYSVDDGHRLDRRLGVALGILLFLERSVRGPRILGP